MEPTRSDQILDEWASVARSASPPGPPPHAATARVAGAGISLAGAAVLVVALVAVFAVLGNRPSQTVPGGLPTASPSPSVALATPMASPTPALTPSPTPTGTPELVVCSSGELVPQITMWEGAAGSRIAHVDLSNMSTSPCMVSKLQRVQLVDGNGHVLIDGAAPAVSGSITIPAHGAVTTLVEAGNYCGSAPVAPVSLAFWFDGSSSTVARPPSNTDATVPPCNGPGQPGTVQMQPWSAK